MYIVRHCFYRCRPSIRCSFRHFIPDGIQNDRRMVTPGLYHCLNILSPVLFKPSGIVMVILRCVPPVKCLVHHIHSKLVTYFQKAFGSGVMGAADGIVSGLLHDPDTPHIRFLERARSKHAMVMVDTATAQQCLFAVYQKPCLRRPLQSANAEPYLCLILLCLYMAGI